MAESEVQQRLVRKLRRVHQTFFERGAENRFNDLVEQGRHAYAELIAALADKDAGERIDALVILGRLFDSHGPTEDALAAVLQHSKTIREGGMGPERQAALFALGRSRDAELIESFVPLLASDDPSAVNVALFVIGYARWRDAAPFVRFLVNQGRAETMAAGIWTLGQLGGDTDSVDLLLPMLRRNEHVEWVVGALGDIGDPAALDDLVPLLTDPRPDVRFLTIASISALVEQNIDRKLRRNWTWMHGPLQVAARDAFPPVAVLALLVLAELGVGLDEARVTELFELGADGPVVDGPAAFYLRADLH
jgi:hypothetical protein